jgi:hypothetical protein
MIFFRKDKVKIDDAIIEYSDMLVRRLIDKIMVNDGGIEVEFKSGFIG